MAQATEHKVEVKKETDYYILDVHILQAKDVKDMDVADKSDTYCICTVDGVSYQTKILANNLNPVWNERCSFLHYTLPNEIQFQLWDSDEKFKDEGLGKAVYPLKGIFDAHHTGFDGWLDIVNKGKINVCIKGTHMKPEAMKEEIHKLQTSNQELKRELEDLQVHSKKELQRLVDEQSALKQQIHGYQETVDNLKKQNTDLFEKYKNLEGLNAELGHNERVTVETLNNKIAALEKEKQDLINRNNVLEKEGNDTINRLREELDSSKSTIQKLDKSLAKSEEELIKLKEELIKSKEELIQSREEMRLYAEKLTERLKSLEEVTQSLKDKEESMTEELNQQRIKAEKSGELTIMLEEQKNTNMKYQKDIATMKEELELSITTAAEVTENIKKKDKELDQYKKTISALKSDLEDSMEKKKELQSALDSLHNICESLKQELRMIGSKNDSDNSNKELEVLRHQVENLLEQNKILSQDKARLLQEKKQQEADINTLRQEVQHRTHHQHPVQTSGLDIRQHRTDNKVVLMGSLAMASTVLFVLMWRMNKRNPQ